MKTLAVIAPVYNEVEVVEAFYAALKKVLKSLEGEYASRILFVVDRSPDGTLEVIRRIASGDPSVQVLALSSRFGHQNSLIAGLDHADADAVVMLDSDLQHPPELIPRLLRAFEDGHDIVYTIREDGTKVSLFKRMTSRLFYRAINLFSNVPIRENASDFRLISRRVHRIYKSDIRERNQFLRGIFSWMGFRTVGVPYRVGSRPGGESKYSIFRMISFGVDGLVSFSKRPLIAAAILGFSLAGFGFAYALAITVDYFLRGTPVSGWPTLVVFVTVLSGTQLIFLGILGIYVGAIFDEVKERPRYIVEERINLPERAR